MKKRILSLLTVLCLVFTLFPVRAFALTYDKYNVHGIEGGKTYCGDTYFTIDIPSEHLGYVAIYSANIENYYILTPDASGRYKIDAGLGEIALCIFWGTGDTSINHNLIYSPGITINSSHAGGTATCTSKAICEYCGKEYGELDPSNHTGGIEVRNVKDATCTENGYTGDSHCKDCKTLLASGKTIPATGHDYKSEVTKEPTSTSMGIRTHTCLTCGYSYTEDIVKLPEEHNHSYIATVTKEADCTNTGIMTYTCSCGDSYTENIPATPTAHKDKNKDHICDVETCKATISSHSGGTATCTSKAICEYCGKEYGELDASNHTGGIEVRNVKDATCTEDGYTGDKYCTSCEEKLSSGTTIPATGHTDGNEDHICDVETCKATISSHSGGTSTCNSKEICEYCGKEYGQRNASNHVGSLVLLNMENHHAHYWSCCGMFAEMHTPIDQNNDYKCDTCGTKLEGLAESEVEIIEPVESITEEVE